MCPQLLEIDLKSTTLWVFYYILSFSFHAKRKRNTVPPLVPKYGGQERKGATGKATSPRSTLVASATKNV